MDLVGIGRRRGAKESDQTMKPIIESLMACAQRGTRRRPIALLNTPLLHAPCELTQSAVPVRPDGATIRGTPLEYSDRWQQRVVSLTTRGDGSVAQELVGEGTSNLLGSYTVRTQVRLVPAGFDPALNALVFPAEGTTESQSEQGGVLRTRFAGRFLVPVDASSVPVTDGWPFSLNWEVTGGTGPFAEAEGAGEFVGQGMAQGLFEGTSSGTLWLPAGGREGEGLVRCCQTV